jgi:hypothetical protein
VLTLGATLGLTKPLMQLHLLLQMVLWQKVAALALVDTDLFWVVWLLVVWEILTQSFLVVVGMLGKKGVVVDM